MQWFSKTDDTNVEPYFKWLTITDDGNFEPYFQWLSKFYNDLV